MPRLLFFCFALLLAGFALLLAGCADAPAPAAPPVESVPVPIQTRADSVALQAIAASGGFDAWNALPALRFDFGVERDGQQQTAARHYWDKGQNRYRVEWPGGPDSTYVALFTAWPDSGRAFVNGTPLDGVAGTEAMETARSRTINDTYWLLAPLKLFDPGVTRTFVPDSSDAATDAIRLSFADVGMTPGDQYWLFIDRASGRLTKWTFVLEGNPTPRSFEWTAYQTLQSPDGRVLLSARKQAIGGPIAILTDNLVAPSTVDETLFTDPQPRL
jgi:hypothetical protein